MSGCTGSAGGTKMTQTLVSLQFFIMPCLFSFLIQFEPVGVLLGSYLNL